MWADKEDQEIFDDIKEMLIAYLYFHKHAYRSFEKQEIFIDIHYHRVIEIKPFKIGDYKMVSYEITEDGIKYLKSIGKQRLLEIVPPYLIMERQSIKESDL